MAIIVNGTTGNDTLTGTTADEEFHGLAGNDIITGNGGSDTFFGGDGNDTLAGGESIDTFYGDAGDDVINGGDIISFFVAPINTLSYQHVASAVTVNLGVTTAQNTIGAGVDTIWHINKLIGSSFDDTLYGRAVSAPAGEEYIDGGLGNDTIFGVRNSGLASDILHGGDGNDIIYAGDIVTSDPNYRGGYSYVYGDSGNDTLVSGSGNATLDGGSGNDTATFNFNGSAVTEVHHQKNGGAVIMSANSTDTLISIENLRFLDGIFTAAAGGDVIKSFIASRPLPDYISTSSTGINSYVKPTLYAGPVSFLEYEYIGNASGNVINAASSSNDFISLLGGDDAAKGDAGDDVIDGGVGSNFLTGGAGHDTFFLDGRGGTITWSTITDFSSTSYDGDEVNIWGWVAGTSKLLITEENGGAPGYTGATLHFDLDNNGNIDTSITFTGLTLAQVPVGQALSVAGNGYLLIA